MNDFVTDTMALQRIESRTLSLNHPGRVKGIEEVCNRGYKPTCLLEVFVVSKQLKLFSELVFSKSRGFGIKSVL